MCLWADSVTSGLRCGVFGSVSFSELFSSGVVREEEDCDDCSRDGSG